MSTTPSDWHLSKPRAVAEAEDEQSRALKRVQEAEEAVAAAKAAYEAELLKMKRELAALDNRLALALRDRDSRDIRDIVAGSNLRIALAEARYADEYSLLSQASARLSEAKLRHAEARDDYREIIRSLKS
jgi:hypothetical protein